jgi:hypothetical protein
MDASVVATQTEHLAADDAQVRSLTVLLSHGSQSVPSPGNAAQSNLGRSGPPLPVAGPGRELERFVAHEAHDLARGELGGRIAHEPLPEGG